MTTSNPCEMYNMCLLVSTIIYTYRVQYTTIYDDMDYEIAIKGVVIATDKNIAYDDPITG